MSDMVVLLVAPFLSVNLLVEEVILRVIVAPKKGPVSGRECGFGTPAR